MTLSLVTLFNDTTYGTSTTYYTRDDDVTYDLSLSPVTLFNHTTYDTSTTYYTRDDDDDITDDVTTLSNIRLTSLPNMTDVKVPGNISSGIFFIYHN